MDKEEFRRVTTEVLREYGFNKKIRNWYFMNMDRVVVHVELCAARFETGAFALMYILCFKDIHEDCEFRTLEDYRNMPFDLGVWKYLYTGEIMERQKGKPYKKWAYYPEEYTEERWRELLKATIHKEFDPLQTDFENYVRENYPPEKLGMGIAQKAAFIERGLIFKEK